jgi:hypothetical protein
MTWCGSTNLLSGVRLTCGPLRTVLPTGAYHEWHAPSYCSQTGRSVPHRRMTANSGTRRFDHGPPNDRKRHDLAVRYGIGEGRQSTLSDRFLVAPVNGRNGAGRVIHRAKAEWLIWVREPSSAVLPKLLIFDDPAQRGQVFDVPNTVTCARHCTRSTSACVGCSISIMLTGKTSLRSRAADILLDWRQPSVWRGSHRCG